MKSPWPAAMVAAASIALAPSRAQAQIDYRNLDDDRPVRIEDAYPVERYGFEFLLPFSHERGRGGAMVHGFVPELEYGLFRNFQLGLKLPLAGSDPGGAPTTWGLSGLRAFALYNFNTESRTLPAVSVRVDGYASTGSLGGSGARGSAKLIATRSFGRNRIHLNGSYGFGRFDTRALVEGGARWWYGAAIDRTLFRQSLLVVAETYALRGDNAERVQVNASLGVRWQWTPTRVLDAGLSRGLRGGLGPEIAFTLGMSHAFAVRGLMPRGPAATPTPGAADAPHRH